MRDEQGPPERRYISDYEKRYHTERGYQTPTSPSNSSSTPEYGYQAPPPSGYGDMGYQTPPPSNYGEVAPEYSYQTPPPSGYGEVPPEYGYQTPPPSSYSGAQQYYNTANDNYTVPWRPYRTPYRRVRVGWLLLLTLLLVGGGILGYTRLAPSLGGLHLPGPSGSSSLASADGIAQFTVGAHPLIIIDNSGGGAINVKVNSTSNEVTLRAVSPANQTNNTPIPYSRGSTNGRTSYTFDTSDFQFDTLNLAVPELTDLQLNTSDADISVDGVQGLMTLGNSNDSIGSITVKNATLASTSSITTDNGLITLTNDQVSGSSNLSSSSSEIKITGTTFHGTTTLQTDDGQVSLQQDTFIGTANLTSDIEGFSVTGTTFTTATLNARTTGSVSLTNTKFTGKATVNAGDSVSLQGATFTGGAKIDGEAGITGSASFGTKGSYQFTATAGDIRMTTPASSSAHAPASDSAKISLSSQAGDIDLTLADNLACHIDAMTDDGSITSDFSSIQVSGFVSLEAHGNIGNGPGPTFTINLQAGDIGIHKA